MPLLGSHRIKQLRESDSSTPRFPIAANLKFSSFGKALREFRKAIDISQEQFALDGGFDRTYLSLVSPSRRTGRTRGVDGFLLRARWAFSSLVGYQDEGYFNALVRMFEQALQAIAQPSVRDRHALIARLDRVRFVSHDFGYGVGDDMDSLLATYVEE